MMRTQTVAWLSADASAMPLLRTQVVPPATAPTLTALLVEYAAAAEAALTSFRDPPATPAKL